MGHPARGTTRLTEQWHTAATRRHARTNVRRVLVAAVVGLLAVLSNAYSAEPAAADRFVAHIQSDPSVPADAKELIRRAWSECNGCDGDEFLTQGLAVLSPRLREGLDAYDAEAYVQSAAIMRDLSKDANPFVAAHATVYEIKALAQAEQFPEANERIESLGADGNSAVAERTYLAPDIAFLRGFCLLADVRYREAAEALESFLRENVDASPRLVVPAQQMLLELSNRESGGMSDVADLMTSCGRRLKWADGGEGVRSRQQKIVDLLNQLVDDAEKREKEQSQSGGGGGSGGSSKSGRSPSSPMQQSTLPGGTSAATEALREQRRANPGESWGSMPPGERERVLQALRESFPSRYRRLVEQYYEDLAKKP